MAVAGAGLVLQGTMRVATEPVKAAWANAHAPVAVRATVHSFIGQAHSIGEITGGVTLGIIASITGITTALAGSALLHTLAAITVARFKRSSSHS